MASIAGRARGGLRWNIALVVMAVVMVVNMFFAFMYAPTEAISGHVQRIMYIHVPMAWLAFLAFFVVFCGSIMYLWKREDKWDDLASSAAELGIIFTTLVLITGPIWAKPTWGVWWTWDPRLTSTLVLWLIYVGYLMLRAYSANRSQGMRFSAVLGIVGFIDVPIVYFCGGLVAHAASTAGFGWAVVGIRPAPGHAAGAAGVGNRIYPAVRLSAEAEDVAEEGGSGCTGDERRSRNSQRRTEIT